MDWEFFFPLPKFLAVNPHHINIENTVSQDLVTIRGLSRSNSDPPRVSDALPSTTQEQLVFPNPNTQMAANGDSRPAPGDRTVIGITFGNSNSSIAYTVDEKAEVIANEDGGELEPWSLSVIL